MKLKLFASVLFISSSLFAQVDIVVKSIIDAPVVKVPVYNKQKIAGQYSMTIANTYAGYSIAHLNGIIKFDSVQVLAVDLVFTDYPSYENLNLLNTKRLLTLFANFPQLLKEIGNIEWRVIRQLDGAVKEKAQQLYHGFVVYYRPLQNSTTAAADAVKLKDMLTPKEVAVRKKHRGFLATDTSRLREIYEMEEYTIVKKMPVPEALEYLGIDAKEKRNYPRLDSILVFEKPTNDSMETKLQREPPEDSTVLNILDRMQWVRMLVVSDVTASMYPYTGQLLLWLKLHEDERYIHQFVFFNDGDRKEEDQKMIGSTGGIYSTSSAIFEEVELLLYKAMHNGSGGAIPENNIEAIVRGIEACPSCREVVMIADNWSGVKDMELLPYVKKPVHIITCGVHDKINTDYLDIARATGGSVHLIEQDINNLAAINEGGKITIGNNIYIIKKGKFRIAN
jgi:hypothetical protein